MAALDYLLERGFTAKKQGMRVRISPASKLTDDVRKYVKAHRLALLAELAANDGLERRCNWSVLVPGCRPFTMISEPITRDEALADVRVRWPGAEVGP
ncbi:UNVERIFIED_ORG: hypothetical protein J2W65_003501 [Pseudomonas parafulva]|uniref:hypothetical protein n=1 Tax=Pseudomonas sp. URMO17WK12:I11 TaxID=1283291 RepID=UPI00119EA8E9|nr:hypothetical protein [Pseudomonas sp. URMO17WK12:I11]MDP9557853.1 hypothetical protein [Pseudomonas parafulva]